jgi:hypothetical protein
MLLKTRLRLHVQEERSDKLDGYSVVESGEGGVQLKQTRRAAGGEDGRQEQRLSG